MQPMKSFVENLRTEVKEINELTMNSDAETICQKRETLTTFEEQLKWF